LNVQGQEPGADDPGGGADSLDGGEHPVGLSVDYLSAGVKGLGGDIANNWNHFHNVSSNLAGKGSQTTSTEH
jgi:hypothetical protein